MVHREGALDGARDARGNGGAGSPRRARRSAPASPRGLRTGACPSGARRPRRPRRSTRRSARRPARCRRRAAPGRGPSVAVIRGAARGRDRRPRRGAPGRGSRASPPGSRARGRRSAARRARGTRRPRAGSESSPRRSPRAIASPGIMPSSARPRPASPPTSPSRRRFEEEHGAHLPARGAHRLPEADLARAFEHAGDHRVDDAERGDEERDARQQRDGHGEHRERALDALHRRGDAEGGPALLAQGLLDLRGVLRAVHRDDRAREAQFAVDRRRQEEGLRRPLGQEHVGLEGVPVLDHVEACRPPRARARCRRW